MSDSDPLSALRTAHENLESVESDVATAGEERVEAVAEAHRRATRLLDRYAESATGSGDFESYLEFQSEFLGFVEELREDLPHREAFETASDRMDKRRLSDSDFAFAREVLEPAGETAGLLTDRDDARGTYRDARREVRQRASELADRIADLERLRRLGEADLDAPVETIQQPIEAYNEGIRTDFLTFRREASARDFLSFIETTDVYPLVEFEQPPSDLREYVDTHAAGEESVAQLLEYADYSTSKLSHYVDDAGSLKTNVAVHRTYLERLGPEPLTVSWPPDPADVLRYRIEEFVAVAGRFADEETVVRLRSVRDLTERDDYERLRTAAEAQLQLTEEERERLARGDVSDELTSARERRERLTEALESYPTR